MEHQSTPAGGIPGKATPFPVEVVNTIYKIVSCFLGLGSYRLAEISEAAKKVLAALRGGIAVLVATAGSRSVRINIEDNIAFRPVSTAEAGAEKGR